MAGDRRYDAVVIGGGQAGLAVGHHLAIQHRDFAILDEGRRVGDAWRARWDGLRLFTPGRLNGLPGMPFPGDPHGFPTKDEVADYLEMYAATFDLPVHAGVRVTDVWPADGGNGFRIVTDDGEYAANQVVIATGAYDRPRIPDFAADLDPGITQLHSSRFRSSSQLRAGTVLVVGASNSGAEIALMAAGAEHPVVLAGRDVGKMPFRPEDRLARTFDTFFWFFVNRIATLDNPIGRKAAPGIRDHGLPLDRVRPSDLRDAGVERVLARATGARHGLPVLDDGRVIEAANVVWATGFRPDHRWIHFDLTGADGWPRQVRGVVTDVPGLYFIGLPFMYRGGSALLGGVGRDAAYLADQMARQATAVLASGSQQRAAAS
ncbi:MAG TPA: NAD(P)/FAD-dependent oxidoreductase [Candidatus Limnocylindria bacterium]|nr:NAD(P)/FAD-dependent oxidoreductase [Candidatus Limnocylindria bacterium]